MGPSYKDISSSGTLNNDMPFSLLDSEGQQRYLCINKDNITVLDGKGRMKHFYRFETIIRWGATDTGFGLVCQKRRMLSGVTVKKYSFRTEEGEKISDRLMGRIHELMDERGLR